MKKEKGTGKSPVKKVEIAAVDDSLSRLRDAVNEFEENPDMHKLRDQVHATCLHVELMLDKLSKLAKMIPI